jgi:hypothetical protein
MLSINTIARVAVNVIRSASQPTSFDTGLLLVKDRQLRRPPKFWFYGPDGIHEYKEMIPFCDCYCWLIAFV